MSVLLPTSYLGSAATAIQLDNGYTRIYYQSANGAIYEATGVAGSNNGYRTSQIVTAENVRINSPIAAVTWGNQIRLFFIDPTHYVHEYCHSIGGHGWVDGHLNKMKYKAAPNSALLYAIINSTTPLHFRVGFQTADAPGVITEATTLSGKWTSAQLT